MSYLVVRRCGAYTKRTYAQSVYVRITITDHFCCMRHSNARGSMIWISFHIRFVVPRSRASHRAYTRRDKTHTRASAADDG